MALEEKVKRFFTAKRPMTMPLSSRMIKKERQYYEKYQKALDLSYEDVRRMTPEQLNTNLLSYTIRTGYE